jgi:tetratricopeptide (TPR) repeat protein
MGLVYMKNAEFDKALEEFNKSVQIPIAKTFGTNSFLAYYNAGVICECLGRFNQAKDYYTKAGEYQKACEALLRIKSCCEQR